MELVKGALLVYLSANVHKTQVFLPRSYAEITSSNSVGGNCQPFLKLHCDVRICGGLIYPSLSEYDLDNYSEGRQRGVQDHAKFNGTEWARHDSKNRISKTTDDGRTVSYKHWGYQKLSDRHVSYPSSQPTPGTERHCSLTVIQIMGSLCKKNIKQHDR